MYSNTSYHMSTSAEKKRCGVVFPGVDDESGMREVGS